MSDSITTVTAVEPGRVELVDSTRTAPGPNEVAGQTLVTLMSPGTELSLAFPVEPRYPLPMALGYAAAFRVDTVGDRVDRLVPGDIVMSMGPHASWQCVRAADVIPVPAGLSPEVAVYSRIMNVPMSAVASSPARPGQRAGVIGLGLIGQLTARVLLATGFETTAADSSQERRSLVGGVCPTVPAIADGSVDFVVECSGREENVLAGARALAPGGELVLTGVPWRRRSDASLFDVADLVFHRYLTMRSGWEWQIPVNAAGPAGDLDMIGLFTRSMQFLRDGTVAVDALATDIGPSEAPGAYEAIRNRDAPTLSYLIHWK